MLPWDAKARIGELERLIRDVERAGFGAEYAASSSPSVHFSILHEDGTSTRVPFSARRLGNDWHFGRAYPVAYRLCEPAQIEAVCIESLHLFKAGKQWNEIEPVITEHYQLEPESFADCLRLDSALHWRQLERYGWQLLSSPDNYAIFDGFRAQYGFPGCSPLPQANETWKVAWVYSLDLAGFEEIERDLTVKTLHALRRCVKPGERIFSVVWHSDGYMFDPHAEIPSMCRDYWAVPVLPDGDHYFFLACDYRFGILSLCPAPHFLIHVL
jgi:hypothetical protein